MLKTISAMIENYDTQMIDYMADIDMQMHAFSSDPWVHDETKMEEDAPGLKPENFVQLKTADQDRGDLTIEIDMEEHIGAEYDMVDDEQDQPGSAAELLDVEVYDVSLAHSPAMVALDSAPPAEPTFSASIVVSPKHQDTILPSVPEPTLSTELLPPPVSQEAQEEVLATAAVPDTHEDVPRTDELLDSNFHQTASQDHVLQLPENDPPKQKFEAEHFRTFEEINLGTVNERSEVEHKDSITHSKPFDEIRASVASDEGPPSGEVENLEHVEEIRVNIESTSSGDPHEISEGVYIDPPPPVLLSVAPEDLEFDHCFFNEPAEWLTSQVDQVQETHRTILHHLPTLYYESLSTLFEALRQEEFIQSNFQLHDAELVLQAVDLALTITEDNIYAREVSLHDLNILHDASGIPGPLRTRICTSSPRFIARYQQLQEHVSLIQLEQAPREILIGIQTEIYNNRHSGSPDHQEHDEESHPYPHPTEGEAVGVNDAADEPSETAEYEPPQNASEDGNGSNTVAEAIQSPYEEELGLVGNEGDNLLTQDSASNTEENAPEPDSHIDGDESQDEAQHGTNGEGDAAVIGLEVLEAEASEQGIQEDDDESDRVSGHEHGDTEGSQEYADNTQDSEANVNDTRQGDAAESAADECEEHTYEPVEDEDHHSHEYGDVEGDLEEPDHLQAFSQHLDEEGNDTEERVKKFDNTSHPTSEIDGQDYAEEAMPALPTDPISFDDEHWELGFEDGGNADGSWNDDDNDHSVSNNSSVTLSSRASKRTYDEYESDGGGYEDDNGRQWELSGSPGAKRSRIE